MLPRNKLVYGTNVESSAAKRYRTNIQPQNGTETYNVGDTITINIPTRNNLVLVREESYLKFQVNYTAGADYDFIRFDSAGSHGLIERIRVWHGSNLLEDITSYGTLSKMLFDLQVSTDSCYGKNNILVGTRNDLIVTIPTTASGDFATPTFTNFNLSATQVNSGMLISGSGVAGAGLLIADGAISQTFCLNLISLVGSLGASRYFPLFACTSAPLRVEITLASSVLATAACSKATTVTITNCEYIAQFIELNDTAMKIISDSQGGGPIQYVLQDYRNYQYSTSVTTTSTQVSMPISAKFASLKSLFVTMRDSANIATATYFPFSCCKFGITQYLFRVGSQVLPSKAPDSISEMFSEVVKAIGSISDLNHQPSIELASYSANVTTANNDKQSTLGTKTLSPGSINSGSFYVGIDLENYANSDKSQIFAGWNSSTDDIYYVPTLVVAAAATIRFDAYALFDSLLVLENNTAYIKY